MDTEKEGTLVYTFEGSLANGEWLVAELDALGFSAYETEGTSLTAYLPEHSHTGALDGNLVEILRLTEFQEVSREHVPPTNWNASWEAGIQPVNAGVFCVHPPWHEPAPGKIPLCVEPKMSFGTAHHPTTRLILGHLEEVISKGDVVLDAGTGTGVLAIAARKLGARSCVGFDIDPWSLENAVENVTRNGVDDIDIRIGGIETLRDDESFDVILANINRGVLLEMLPVFKSRLRPNGRVILSGILDSDRPVMLPALTATGFAAPTVFVEGEWIAVSARPA